MPKYDKFGKEIRQTWLFVDNIKELKELARENRNSIAEMIDEMLKFYKLNKIKTKERYDG